MCIVVLSVVLVTAVSLLLLATSVRSMLHTRGKSTIEFNNSFDDVNNESNGIYKNKRMPTINKKSALTTGTPEC
jgi:hypothetical protein